MLVQKGFARGFAILGTIVLSAISFTIAAPTAVVAATPNNVGAYSWTHSVHLAGSVRQEPVETCEVGEYGPVCQVIGTDDIESGGDWQDNWISDTYQGGTTSLNQVWLSVLMYCTNYIGGGCLGTYVLATNTSYSDGSSYMGPYYIQTNDNWMSYLWPGGLFPAIREGYEVNTSSVALYYPTITGNYNAIVNSNTGPSYTTTLTTQF